MAKRGRKPKNDGNKIYFGDDEEQHFMDYLSAPTKDEKELIYVAYLEPVLKTMIESIIRRYNLYIPDESFDDIFNDTLSHLMTKLDKFRPDKGKKAYSYYGTICKNHLINRIEKFKKEMERNPLYDSVSEEFINNVRYSYTSVPGVNSVAEEIINKLIERIKQILDEERDQLKENEIKIGKALILLFEHWDDLLFDEPSNNDSEKLTKSKVLYFLREHTGLDTINIRNNIKKFKREFLIIKEWVVG